MTDKGKLTAGRCVLRSCILDDPTNRLILVQLLGVTGGPQPSLATSVSLSGLDFTDAQFDGLQARLNNALRLMSDKVHVSAVFIPEQGEKNQ